MNESIPLAPRLDRGLRLEEMLVSAIAMPLPDAPISAQPEPQEIQASAVADIDGTTARSADNQTSDHPQADADARVHLDPAPQDAPDAVAGSLEASRQAIRVSLHPESDAPAHADAAPPDLPQNDPAPVHAHAHGTQIMPIGDAAPTSTVLQAASAGDPAAVHGADADVAPHIPLSIPVFQASAPDAAATAGILPTPDLTMPDHLGALLTNPVGLVGVATGAAPGLIDPVGGVAGAVHGSLGALSGDLGSVTIPSLQGNGFDALNNLLPQPAAFVLNPSDPELPSVFEHPVLSLPIGLGDDHHTDPGLAHLPHPSLPLIGSGLI